eukprot:CAMPEP_0201618226 /NCGR_PEP_ID=MMETSP0492-20130828/38371_1 /ASSEMBLY_ACC=CAM_ASM_000837 /TAXON_ID=420259 /ORGANISM="Thalassiosira gravida, Strain GMp14c1" /LENGTH=47 /DNA_ID= /DNA_START= /DNA_END= /DNA_ORIENTATION=
MTPQAGTTAHAVPTLVKDDHSAHGRRRIHRVKKRAVWRVYTSGTGLE